MTIDSPIAVVEMTMAATPPPICLYEGVFDATEA